MVRRVPQALPQPGIAATTFPSGNGTPMIPVEEGKTSSKMQPKVSAAATHVFTHASIPASSGRAVRIARIDQHRPNPSASRRQVLAPHRHRCRHHPVLRITSPPHSPPPGATATATSGFPLSLIPAFTAPHRNPRGKPCLYLCSPPCHPQLYKQPPNPVRKPFQPHSGRPSPALDRRSGSVLFLVNSGAPGARSRCPKVTSAHAPPNPPRASPRSQPRTRQARPRPLYLRQRLAASTASKASSSSSPPASTTTISAPSTWS